MLVPKTSTEAFYQLIVDGQNMTGITLDHDLEAFMVYALLRNIDNIELKEIVFAHALLSDLNENNMRKLEEILDCSLIYAGWYPKRAEKFGLSSCYYSDIGKFASSELARYYEKLRSSCQSTYAKIAWQFDKLVMVLQSLLISKNIEYIRTHSCF
ncbi:hypothetical protein [Fastidiosibacter lacustris]|uniref:hypothetical protein n=1 Tax=Fastidiosibacter lacustris TaxID=2056695 RepID=UPI000E34DBAF|nr:hypothetical protein [Fastidiosibacter lacustris]